MNGDIRVYSNPSHGSVFVICIPSQSILPTLDLSPCGFNENEELLNHSPRAMIVDDDKFSQKVLEACFNKLKFDIVSTACNGVEAVEKYIQCC